jgi:hypothetical protein
MLSGQSAEIPISIIFRIFVCILDSFFYNGTSSILMTRMTTGNDTYNLLRTHDSELDLSDLPDRRGGVRERDRHRGRFYLVVFYTI